MRIVFQLSFVDHRKPGMVEIAPAPENRSNMATAKRLRLELR
jgi:hypothetical protein